MSMVRVLAAAVGFGVAPLAIAACGSDRGESPSTTDEHVQHSDAPAPPGRGAPPGPSGAQNGHWNDNGQPVNGGPTGADGSTDNGLSQEYCAQNEDPGCPAGSYVGPDAIPNPNGDNNYVPCEGTIFTNPNHGAGDDPENQQPPGSR
jgi:hypothetical protein